MMLLLTAMAVQAQEVTGRINGRVQDAVTNAPMAGATLRLLRDSVVVGGAVTGEQGDYVIAVVPVGRYALQVEFEGYRSRVVPDVVVLSSKTTVVDAQMEEMVVEVNAVTIEASKAGEAQNEMSTVSARSFSVAEAERYAGSRGDPARMASNFAGVQGTDDTRNDLVIRGNSPLGVNYRLDGVNIPNPNHFAITGSAGGPVGMLNNKVLASSDFFTGAFPAEYGNSLAGTFDLKFRKGITDRHEFTLQAGIFGAEATGEGPLGKANKSGLRPSYLFNLRYATLSFFAAAGIDIGTTAIPKYSDMAFKLNFPLKNGAELSWFGLGGKSKIDFVVSDDERQDAREIFASGTRDEYFRAGMGVTGLRFTKLNGSKGLFRVAVAYALEHTNMNQFDVWRHTSGPDSTFVLDSITRNMGFRNNLHRVLSHVSYRHKFNARHSMQFGLVADAYYQTLHDSIVNVPGIEVFHSRMNYDGLEFLLQPYAQWKYNVSERLSLSAGVHGQVFTLNSGSMAIEPRAGLKWAISNRQSINIGTGLHSQLQPYYIYFQQQADSNGIFSQHNTDLGFSRSLHLVLGHDWFIGKFLRTRVEVYYQYLFKAPVDTFNSSFSMLNQGSGFDRYFPGKLVNDGTGRNYGMELTVEKFFSHNWFVLATASLFDSKYVGSDGRTYNTDFNSNFVANLLGTKEFNWGKKRKVTLGIGGKITYAGGKRYSPLDTLASITIADEVVLDSARNTLQFPNYFRADVKLYYRINAAKLTHEIGIDLVNVTGQQNLLRLQYVGGTKVFAPVNQIGFLPIFYYRVNFAVGRKGG